MPPDICINGASIPWYAFSFVGTPWSTEYAKPAAVHDYYCEIRSRPWQEVHEVLYFCLRASGVSYLTAKIMYGAVYWRGPRWDLVTGRRLGAGGAEGRLRFSLYQQPIYGTIDERQFLEFDFENATLDDIRAADQLRFTGERDTRIQRYEPGGGGAVTRDRLQTLQPEMFDDATVRRRIQSR